MSKDLRDQDGATQNFSEADDAEGPSASAAVQEREERFGDGYTISGEKVRQEEDGNKASLDLVCKPTAPPAHLQRRRVDEVEAAEVRPDLTAGSGNGAVPHHELFASMGSLLTEASQVAMALDANPSLIRELRAEAARLGQENESLKRQISDLTANYEIRLKDEKAALMTDLREQHDRVMEKACQEAREKERRDVEQELKKKIDDANSKEEELMKKEATMDEQKQALERRESKTNEKEERIRLWEADLKKREEHAKEKETQWEEEVRKLNDKISALQQENASLKDQLREIWNEDIDKKLDLLREEFHLSKQRLSSVERVELELNNGRVAAPCVEISSSDGQAAAVRCRQQRDADVVATNAACVEVNDDEAVPSVPIHTYGRQIETEAIGQLASEFPQLESFISNRERPSFSAVVEFLRQRKNSLKQATVRKQPRGQDRPTEVRHAIDKMNELLDSCPGLEREIAALKETPPNLDLPAALASDDFKSSDERELCWMNFLERLAKTEKVNLKTLSNLRENLLICKLFRKMFGHAV